MNLWPSIAKFLARPAIRDWLINHAANHPYEHILDKDQSLYMGRWWVLKERAWFPWAARIHYIAREDRDRDLHDHPYDYRTVILRGGYIERDIFGKSAFRRRGDTVAARAQTFHKIVTVELRTFTLFIYRHRKVSNPWGFLQATKNGTARKVHWREYLNVGRDSKQPADQS